MKDQRPALPGYTIASIAVVAGISFEHAALAMATLLGAVAGPSAGILGPAGELINPGLNSLFAGADNRSWASAQELLIEPLTACQRMFRELSRATAPQRLDYLQFSRFTADRTNDIVDRSKADVFRGDPGPAEYVCEDRHFVPLRLPTFLLLSPDVDTFQAAMDEVLDRWPLILDPAGRMFAELLKNKAPAKGQPGLAALIAAALLGHDSIFANVDGRYGPGRAEVVKAHFFSTCSRQQFLDALDSDNPDVQHILQHSVIVDADASIPTGKKMVLQDMQWGYANFYERVKQDLNARRAGTGLQYKLQPQEAQALHDFSGELRDWCGNLPEALRPFFRDILSLPYRIHWAILTSLCRSESDRWCLPFTLHATRALLEGQRKVLAETLTAADHQEHERARLAMMLKLLDEPLMFRDLLRRYSLQRRDVHQPVLNELLGEGLVRLRDEDGLLELTDEGRDLVTEAGKLRAA